MQAVGHALPVASARVSSARTPSRDRRGVREAPRVRRRAPVRVASARVRRLARAVARRGQRAARRHLGVAHGTLPELAALPHRHVGVPLRRREPRARSRRLASDGAAGHGRATPGGAPRRLPRDGRGDRSDRRRAAPRCRARCLLHPRHGGQRRRALVHRAPARASPPPALEAPVPAGSRRGRAAERWRACRPRSFRLVGRLHATALGEARGGSPPARTVAAPGPAGRRGARRGRAPPRSAVRARAPLLAERRRILAGLAAPELVSVALARDEGVRAADLRRRADPAERPGPRARWCRPPRRLPHGVPGGGRLHPRLSRSANGPPGRGEDVATARGRAHGAGRVRRRHRAPIGRTPSTASSTPGPGSSARSRPGGWAVTPTAASPSSRARASRRATLESGARSTCPPRWWRCSVGSRRPTWTAGPSRGCVPASGSPVSGPLGRAGGGPGSASGRGS